MPHDLTLNITTTPSLLLGLQVKMTIATRGMGIIVFERIYAYSNFENATSDMTKVFDQYDIDTEGRRAILKEMLIERARTNGGDDAAEDMRSILEATEDVLESLGKFGELLNIHLISDTPMDESFVQ